MIELRKYQKEAKEKVLAEWNKGNLSTLLAMATGTGKTEAFLSILASEYANGNMDRALIVAHRIELIEQPYNRILSHWSKQLPQPGIVMASHNDVESQIVIATIQTLSVERRLTELLSYGAFSHLVLDEAHHCHVPGAMIATENGLVAIEDVEIGNMVYGWDGESFGLHRVSDKFEYLNGVPIYDIITCDGNKVSVTGNHKLYSEGEYVYARNIEPGQTISVPFVRETVGESHHSPAFAVASSGDEALSKLLGNYGRTGFTGTFGETQAGKSSVSPLREDAPEKFDWWARHYIPSGESYAQPGGASGSDGKAQSKYEVSKVPVGTNEEEQSDGFAYIPLENEENNQAEDKRWGNRGVWWEEVWERQGENASGKLHSKALPIGRIRILGNGWRRGEALSLQDRFCLAELENWPRGGWEFAQEAGAQGIGFPEREPVESNWVGVAKDTEQRCGIRESTVSSVSIRNYAGMIYDFEVEGVHNYIANGILSSNSTNPSTMALVESLRNASPNLKILGVTATPRRSDNDGLTRVFDSVAYKVSIKDAIVLHKCLSPFLALAINLPVDISQVEIRGEDYDSEQLGTVLSADNALELIVEMWQKHASGRPTMAFTASVAQAAALCGEFRRAGISAAWASGETKSDERRQILDDYQSGKVQVLCNCQLWTEGFDAPHTSCVLMARPTRSDSVYVQAIGRGLRVAPGKTDCTILDFVPEGSRDLCLAGDLLGKPKVQKKAEQQGKDSGVILDAYGIDSDGNGIDGDPDEVIVRALDFFSNQSSIQWTFDGKMATAAIDYRVALAIVLPDAERIRKANELRKTNEWLEKYEKEYQRISGYQVYCINGRVELLNVEPDWEAATILAESKYEQIGNPKVAKRKRSWRKMKPSDKQMPLALSLGLDISESSRGAAAQAITHAIVTNQLRKARVIL